MDMMPTQPTTNQPSPLTKRRKFTPYLSAFPPSSLSSLGGGEISPTLLARATERAPTPDEIESQLLQVGMRVRKSIADGYQTPPSKHAFTPRPFFNSSRLSPDTLAALNGSNAMDTNDSGSQTVSLPTQPLSRATFCGINLNMLSHIGKDYSAPKDDSYSSQAMWTYSTSAKRRHCTFDDESSSDSDESEGFMPRTPLLGVGDAEVAGPMDYFSMDVGEVSPMAPYGSIGRRRLAKPRSRLRLASTCETTDNPFASAFAPAPAFPREYGNANCDFEEAGFLQPRDDVEMDCS